MGSRSVEIHPTGHLGIRISILYNQHLTLSFRFNYEDKKAFHFLSPGDGNFSAADFKEQRERAAGKL